jgi:hypothetical protein
MAWIKRNLFFFIGGVVALGLLGAAGYYNYTSWSRNSDMLDKLKEIYGTLTALNDPQSNPGNDKVNKIEMAKDQAKQLRDWLDQSKVWFAPIPPIPPSTTADPVSSETFAAALRRTIDIMQHEAEAANVHILTPDYGFSFEAERSLVKFSPGSLDLLSVQLGEVKTISEILFAAGVNELDSIQRVHVSNDDANGPQGDYINDPAVTSDQAVLTPYVVSFQSFGPEIARVFAGFAGSPHCFIIKSINVQPTTGNNNQAGPMNMPGQNMRGRGDYMYPQPNQPMVPTGKGGLTTVLKEQLLHVSLEVEIVKLQPKN